MIRVHEAPSTARKLCKSTGYIRRTLSDISKQEQARAKGATEARVQLTEDFAAKVKAADDAVLETEQAADDLDALSLDLRSTDTPKHPKARAMRLLGHTAPRTAALSELACLVGSRLRDAAHKAQDRLDQNADDLTATALHALMLSKLPKCDFNIRHHSLKALRTQYQAHVEASKKARK